MIHARERDALDRRYNVGKWTHWYDRNIIYPYSKVTPGIEAAIRENEKKDGGLGWGER